MSPPQPPSVGAPKELDDLFADVAQLAPGFGGLYVDEDQDTLYVYLLQNTPEAVAALQAALTAVFGDQAPKESRLVVLQGQYDFLDLWAWRKQMRTTVFGIPGVVMLDIADSRNRLTVGVEASEAKDLVEEQLALLGIPREAVNIEKASPVIPGSNLQGYHRPLVGGLQVAFFSPTGELWCTLGFMARREGVLGFVTNAHCTHTLGAVEGTVFYQPVASNPANRIGFETVDPPYVPGCDGCACPQGRFCRYSDSAFAQLDAGVAADRGFIAKADEGVPSWGGGTYRIVQVATIVMEGERMVKVGRTTGKTIGQIKTGGACVDFHVSTSNISYFCQVLATNIFDGGDSGSPVFKVIQLDLDVRLYGIAFGAVGQLPGEIVFSPIYHVQRPDELGPLSVCAPLHGC